MTKQEIIKNRYPFYDEDIAQKDVELNAEAVMQLMDDYLISELKSLVEDLKSFHSEYIIENINSQIDYLENGI